MPHWQGTVDYQPPQIHGASPTPDPHHPACPPLRCNVDQRTHRRQGPRRDATSHTSCKSRARTPQTECYVWTIVASLHSAHVHCAMVQPRRGAWDEPGPPNVCVHSAGSTPAKMADAHTTTSLRRNYLLTLIPLIRDEQFPCAGRRYCPGQYILRASAITGPPPPHRVRSVSGRHRRRHPVEVRGNPAQRLFAHGRSQSSPFHT